MLLNSKDYAEYKDDFGNVLMRVPFKIGTIVEAKENPTGVFVINQYRIAKTRHNFGIYAGLSMDIYDEERIDCEVSINELSEKWKATDLTSIDNLDPRRFGHDIEYYAKLNREKRLLLTKEKSHKK